ncbi:MAG: DUF975 family protein [Clostridia bacterium]|nr:DUF975 family protein [Clostridia bacterium]
MVTNYELKLRARIALKDNWQTALMVALIASLPSLASQVVAIMTKSSPVILLNNLANIMQENPYVMDITVLLEQAGVTMEKCMPSVLLGVVSALVSPFLTLGMLHYFFKVLRGEKDAAVETVFSRKDCFFKAIGLRIMLFLRILLWMLPGYALMLLPVALIAVSLETAFSLLPMFMFLGTVTEVVLAIRAGLHYAMADRVMAETPSKGINQCFRDSIAIMRQRKMLLFLLQVSFVLLQAGLMLLESLLMNLMGQVVASTLSMALNFVLNIYMQMAVSAFYLAYSAQMQN